MTNQKLQIETAASVIQDYEKVDDILQKQREIAKAYLCQSIGE